VLVTGRDLSLGSQTVLEAPEGITGFNDLTTTDDGAVIVGALRFRPLAGDRPVPGEVWHVGADLGTTILTRDVVWPNGIGVSPAGDVLYVSDFAAGHVLRLNPDGTDRAVFADVPGSAPDGLAVDAEGFVWVALGPAGAIARFASDGRLDHVLDVPAEFVASVAFDRDRLLVATAGALLRLPVGVEGRPVPPAAIAA
jgi:gluconolactonase